MNIGFIGLGKLGFPVALAVEAAGHHVLAYDPDPTGRIRSDLTNRKLSFEEVGANELLATSKIALSPLATVVHESDILFMPVQTPHDPRFEGSTPIPANERKDFDYSFLVQAVKDVVAVVGDRPGRPPVVLSIISTVLPGTIEREVQPLIEGVLKLRLCYNPFFIAMGTTIRDFIEPEFVLLGNDDQWAAEQMEDFYATIHSRPVFKTAIKNAELIKVCYNTYISTKIAIANTIMEICHKVGADCDQVVDALSMATRRLISPAYMRGGMGDAGACLPPWSLVRTNQGLRPIWKIAVGDMVLTHKGRFRRVTNVFQREYSGPMVEIEISGRYKDSLMATPNHPVFSSKRLYVGGNRYRMAKNREGKQAVRMGVVKGHEPEPSFRPISELEKSDLVAWCYNTERELPAPSIQVNKAYSDLKVVSMTPDIMWMLGLFLADGSVYCAKGKYEVCFSLNTTTKREAATKAKKILQDTYGIVVREQQDGQKLDLRFTHKGFGQYALNNFGHGATSKTVPMHFLDLPVEFLEQFLTGLFRGDGSIDTKKFHFYTSSSDVRDFVDLALTKLHISHGINSRPDHTDKNGVHHCEAYTILSTDNAIARLIDHPFRKTKQKATLFHENGLMMAAIKNTSEISYEGFVYDLEVEEDHSFQTNLAAVHNCHPRDNIAMSWLARKLDLSHNLFEDIMECREDQTFFLNDLIESEMVSGSRVFLCGRAFKPNTNIVTGSAAVLLAHVIRSELVIEPTFIDPFTGDKPPSGYGDKPVFFISAAHDHWFTFPFPAGATVIDPFRRFHGNPSIAQCRYIPIGRSARY